MNDYSQPDFYRFNEDSLKLVSFIKTKVSQAQSILDLGAGSGIIGIELAGIYRPTKLTLLELQDEYLPHLKINAGRVTSTTTTEIKIASFGEWKTSEKFDLIACNPPYFLQGHGEASRDLRKYKARTFMVDNWSVLLNLIARSLTSDGKAYLVYRNDHRISLSHSDLRINRYEEGKLVFLELFRLNKN